MAIPLDGFDDFRAFVNPLIASRAELTGEPYRIIRARGDEVWDVDGSAFIDLLAGWGTQPFGHRDPDIEAALREFLDSPAPAFFTSSVSPFAGALARELCALSGKAYSRAWFGSSGGESVDAAIKLALAATGRPRVLSLKGAYHGCTVGGTALMEPGPYAEPFNPYIRAADQIAVGDIDALKQALSGGEIAAILIEPVQMEAGVHALPSPFIAALGDLTERHGTLLIADEIQTGLGRSGYFLATETWPRRPDAVVLGKGLGGGLMPISAMLTTAEWFDRAYGTFARSESHTSTWSGNSLACVAARSLVSKLDPEVYRGAAEWGSRLRARLEAALAPSPVFAGVRGMGLLTGIEFATSDHPWHSFEGLGLPGLSDLPAVGMLICHRLYRAGWLVSVCGHSWSTLRVHPALNIGAAHLEAFVGACQEACAFVCNLQ